MILAQIEHIIVRETKITSGAPWHIYGAAVIAGLIAIGGWVVVHRTSQSRDLKNWRRTTLLEAVATLIESSIARRDQITTAIGPYDRFTVPRSFEVPDEARESYRKLSAARYQIKICIADEVLNFSDKIIELHTTSNTSIERLKRSFMTNSVKIARNMTEEQIINDEALAEIDLAELTDLHDQLINALQVEIDLKKSKKCQWFRSL